MEFKFFEVKQLLDSKANQVKSVPLVIPNDTEYDEEKGVLVPRKDCARRTSLLPCKLALDLLKTIKKPIAVLAVAGPCRTGKSYILSRILGIAEAFQLGHSVNSQTMGIWMGTSVLDCEDYCILLLDTEGIDSVAAEATNDAKILVTTLLLSSYFIYNSMGIPHNNDLEKMSIFTKLARSVIVQDDSRRVQDCKNFPPFLWLLRDFQFKVEDESGKKLTPTEYLRDVVLKEDESGVCEAIGKFFVSFECQILPPPATDPEVLASLDKHREKVMVFWTKVDSLVTSLKSVVQPKKVFDGSGVVDGCTLATLVEETTKAINDPESVPTLDNTWKLVVKSRCQVVLDELLEEYNSIMRRRYKEASKGCPLEEVCAGDDGRQTLMGIHHDVHGQLIETLKQKLGGLLSSTMTGVPTQDSIKNELEKKLVQYNLETSSTLTEQVNKLVGGALYPFVEENKRRSQEYCQDLFVRLYNPIKTKVQDANKSEYVLEDLEGDIKKLWEDFDNQAIGPQKSQVRHQGLQTIESDKKMFEIHLKDCEVLLTSIRDKQQEQEKHEELKGVLQDLVDGKERQEKQFANFLKEHKESERNRREKTDLEMEEMKVKIGEYEEKERLRQKETIRRELEEMERRKIEDQRKKEKEEKFRLLQELLQQKEAELEKRVNEEARRRKEEEERQAKDRIEIETMQGKVTEKAEKLKKMKEEQERRLEDVQAEKKKEMEQLEKQKKQNEKLRKDYDQLKTEEENRRKRQQSHFERTVAVERKQKEELNSKIDKYKDDIKTFESRLISRLFRLKVMQEEKSTD